MRHAQARLVDHGRSAQDEVEVEGPRSPGVGALSTFPTLEFEQQVEQGPRRIVRPADQCPVQEWWLFADAYRVGFYELGNADVRQMLAERFRGAKQVGRRSPRLLPSAIATGGIANSEPLFDPAGGHHAAAGTDVSGTPPEQVETAGRGLFEEALVLGDLAQNQFEHLAVASL